MEVRAPQSVTRPLRATAPLAPPVAQRETAVLEQAPQTRTFDLSDNPDYQRLKAEGKLTPDVMAQLQLLATESLAKGVNRTELISGALAELADPSSIRQGDRDTCAATVVQSQLAEDQPAEYLRLIAGLASPAGKATLANGDTIQRDSDWDAPSGRSLIGNLMQPAFMAYAAGGYDNATDTRRIDAGKGQGLYAGEQNKLEDAVTGKQTVTVFGNGSDMSQALKAAMAQGQSVPVIVTAKDPATGKLQAHSLLIERIDGDLVTYLDPKGKRKTASLADVMAHLQSADVPPRCASPSLLKASQGHDRGVLAGDGFWSGLAGAIGGAVSSAASAVSGAVSTAANVVSNAVSTAVSAVSHALSTAAGAVSNAIGTAASAIDDNVVQPVVKGLTTAVQALTFAVSIWAEIAKALVPPAVQAFGQMVWEKTVAAAQWIKDNQASIISGVGMACAVIPGLQPLALVVAGAQGLLAVIEIVKGAQDHDWKEALTGVTDLLQAAATEFGGGYLSKALSSVAKVTSRVLGGLARVAKSGAELAEALSDKADATTRWGKGIAFVADLFGGSVGAIGDSLVNTSSRLGAIAEKAVEASAKFATIADQASTYYTKSTALYAAIMDPSALTWGRGLEFGREALDLEADIDTDTDGADTATINQLRDFSGYAKPLEAIDKGIESGDWKQTGAELFTAATLGAQITRDAANGWDPSGKSDGGDLASIFNRVAAYAGDVNTELTGSDWTAQVGAGLGIIGMANDDAHVPWERLPGYRPVKTWADGVEKPVVQWGTGVEKSAIDWGVGVEKGAVQWAKDYAVEVGWAPAPEAQ